MTLDEIVGALPDVGFRLKNLFGRSDGTWEAHVHDVAAHPDTYAFGRAATPAEAIAAALKGAGVTVED